MSQFVSKEQEQIILKVANKIFDINKTKLLYTPNDFFKYLGEDEKDKFDDMSLPFGTTRFKISIKYFNDKILDIISFNVGQLYGCCGSAILSGVSIHNCFNHSFHGNGLGSLSFKIATNIAYQYGYSSIVATDIDDNAATKHIFEKQGWKIVNQFVNKRTDNLVNTYIKNFYED